ncbi:hypothetical protein BGZ98_010132, partial [Dissophora globulifera]
MFTRITGRDPHRQQQQHPLQISAPILTSSSILLSPRSRSRLGTLMDVPMVNGSLVVSSTLTRKKLNRRSLSADSLMTAKVQRPLGLGKSSDSSLSATARPWKQASLGSLIEKDYSATAAKGVHPRDYIQKHDPRHERGYGTQAAADLEFYKTSVEFLNTHYSRNCAADNWATRNKRRPSIPMRRQSESSLLCKILEVTRDTSLITEPEIAIHVPRMIHDISAGITIQVDAEDSDSDDGSDFGLGSYWKDLEPTCSSSSDIETEPEEYRSLLSSVDIMMVSSISSPTLYYDCLKSRNLVRTYLTMEQCKFDEVIDYGFPSAEVIDDKDGKTKDCRFLTLRLTLTPWHARADESKLYGMPADFKKPIPPRGMVNKFLTRTSAMLSSSPPRAALCLAAVATASTTAASASDSSSTSGSVDAKQSHYSRAKDIKLHAPDNGGLPTKVQLQQVPSAATTPSPSSSLSSSPGVHPFSGDAIDSTSHHGHANAPVHTTLRGGLRGVGEGGEAHNANGSLPKNKAGASALRKEKGFRITDVNSTGMVPHHHRYYHHPTLNLAPSLSPALIPLPLSALVSPSTPSLSYSTNGNNTNIDHSVRPVEFLSKDPDSCCSSTPTTPSPTTALHHPENHPYHHQQQHHYQLQPPRKGSLSALSLPMNTHNAAWPTSCTTPEGPYSAGNNSNMSVPPVIPPRRKASSPAIFCNNDADARRYQSPMRAETAPYSLSCTDLTATNTAMITPRPKLMAKAAQRPSVSSTPSLCFSPSPWVKNACVEDDTTLPIPIPGAASYNSINDITNMDNSGARYRHQYHHHQQQQQQQHHYTTAAANGATTDSDIYGGIATTTSATMTSNAVMRTPRALARKRTDLMDSTRGTADTSNYSNTHHAQTYQVRSAGAAAVGVTTTLTTHESIYNHHQYQHQQLQRDQNGH